MVVKADGLAAQGRDRAMTRDEALAAVRELFQAPGAEAGVIEDFLDGEEAACSC